MLKVVIVCLNLCVMFENFCELFVKDEILKMDIRLGVCFFLIIICNFIRRI